MGMFFNEDINTLFVEGSAVSAAYVGSEQVWPVGLPSGTVFNFEYTGNVQSVELPRGRYKLQCWGAQGGTSYGSSNGAGSKGGYSEGVLTLTEKTTLYVFVGGAGSRGSSTSLVNGGWNGGGASVGYSSYGSTSGGSSASSGNGYSYPACGGGATDISTVTSSMSYSGGRTNRSSASLLARCIVAGGGAGGSYRYSSWTKTNSSTSSSNSNVSGKATIASGSEYFYKTTLSVTIGATYSVSSVSSGAHCNMEIYRNGSFYKSTSSFTFTSGYSYSCAVLVFHSTYNASVSATIKKTVTTTTSSTQSSSGYSNKSQVGGGTNGGGSYPGTQTSAGSGGAFGLGANQTTTNYRYCAGGGGGGWYGGGTSCSDSSTGYVDYSGGGSGFVNTAANASYRPSEYTGLQLDSGITIAGNSSFESVSGSTETGHSGNGYARITVLNNKYTTIPYIEATGTQWIDTGFAPNNNTRLVMDAQCVDDSGVDWVAFFGSRENSNTQCFGIFSSGQTNPHERGFYGHIGSTFEFFAGDAMTRFSLDANKNVVSINGEIAHTFPEFEFQNTINIHLFVSKDDNVLNFMSKIRLYSCQIYDNDVLVRDFVPKLNPDGIAGLWDNVNKVFYKSDGSNEFIAGT